MANLKDIQIRIVSVKGTQQITKAMKMVSASKMKRAEDRVRAARPYSDKLGAMVSNLAAGLEDGAHPLLEERKGGKAVVVFISSDKGLCGGLNSNLFKAWGRFLEEKRGQFDDVEMICIGKKANEFFGSRGGNIVESFKEVKDAQQEGIVTGLINTLVKRFEEGEINHLYVAYNEFKNVITQIPHITAVLPVETPELEEGADEVEYLFEPSRAEILDTILPMYVVNKAFTSWLDNGACEHAARMTAMDSATNNASEMIDKLQLQYNRARQAAITTELSEIISGAESL